MLCDERESDEVLALRQQLQTLKELFKAARAPSIEPTTQRPFNDILNENERYKQRIEQLTAAIIEREKKIADLQNAQKILVTLTEKIKEVERRAILAGDACRQEAAAKIEAQKEASELHLNLDILKANHSELQQALSALQKEKEEWLKQQTIWHNQQAVSNQQAEELLVQTREQTALIEELQAKCVEYDAKEKAIEDLQVTLDKSHARVAELQELLTSNASQSEFFEVEKRNLIEERDKFKQQLEITRQVVERKEERILHYQYLNEEAEKKNDTLKTELSERQQLLDNTRKQIEEVNEKAYQTERDAQELIQEHAKDKEDAQNEATALHAQMEALKSKFFALKDQTASIELEKTQWLNEKETLIHQLHTVNNDLEESRRLLAAKEQTWEDERNNLISQKQNISQALEHKQERELYLQRSLEASEKHIQEYLSEKQQQFNELLRTRAALEEAESRLKMAHQHLAKKVREVTELRDVQERNEQDLSDRADSIKNLQLQINTLKNELQEHRESESRNQSAHEERLRAAESLAASWEEKYNSLYEKLQASENRIAELMLLEEKHRQMHAAWAGFSGFFQPAQTELPREAQGNEREASRPNRGRRPYQNLFGLPSAAPSDE